MDVPGTCRAESDHTFLYVADNLWENGIGQPLVNAFMAGFEEWTPEGSINSQQGIWANNTQVFGEPEEGYFPDGKAKIFVLDTDGYGDGYVPSWVDEPVLHIDGAVRPLDDPATLSVTSHEFFHVLHQAFDPNEEVWMDESLAEAAMIVNGYYTDTAWVEDFIDRPDVSWGPGNTEHGDLHYGAALLWGTFLWEQWGSDFMRALVAEASNGFTGIDDTLTSLQPGETSAMAYRNWMVTCWAEGQGATDPAFSFAFAELPSVRTTEGPQGGSTVEGSVNAYGIDYLTFGEGTHTLRVDSADPSLLWLATGMLVGDAVEVTYPEGGEEFVLDVSKAYIAAVAVSSEASLDYTVSSLE